MGTKVSSITKVNNVFKRITNLKNGLINFSADGNDVSAKLSGIPYENVYVIDGTTYAKSAVGIQAAIDAVPTQGRAAIILTQGTYASVAQEILVTDKSISFITDGSVVHLNRASGFTGNIFKVTHTSSWSYFGNFAFEDIRINNGGYAGTGILIQGGQNLLIKNVTVFGGASTNSYGIILDTTASASVANVKFDRCRLYGNFGNLTIRNSNTGSSYINAVQLDGGCISAPQSNGYNIKLLNAPTSPSLTMNNVYIEEGTDDITKTGIVIEGTGSIISFGCHADFQVGTFIDVTAATTVTYPSCIFYGLYMGDSNSNANFFKGNDNYPIYVYDNRNNIYAVNATKGRVSVSTLATTGLTVPVLNNFIYVAPTANIETAINNATAGSVLMLAPNTTYTVATNSDIDIDKAITLIGNNTIIEASQTSVVPMMSINSSNVKLYNITFNYVTNVSSANAAVEFALDNYSYTGIVFENITINAVSSGTGTLTGLKTRSVSGTFRNVVVNVTGVSSVWAHNAENSANNPAVSTLNVYESKFSVVTSGGSNAFAGQNYDNGSTYVATVNYYGCEFNASGSSSNVAVRTNGGDATTNIYNCIASGTTYDLQRASGTLNTYNSILKNGTTNGTVNYLGNLGTVTATSINSPSINGVIYIDGTTYPRTSAGIQAAIDSVATGDSATIVCTDGEYDITSTISWVNKGITLRSSSGERPSDNDGAYFKVNALFASGPVILSSQTSAIAYSNRPSVHIVGININFNGNTNVTAGIATAGFLKSSIKNCRINGAGVGSAVILDTAPSCPVSIVDLSGNKWGNTIYGLRYMDSGNSYHTFITLNRTIIFGIWLAGSCIYSDASANETSIEITDCYLESGTTAIGTGRKMINCAAVRFQIRCLNTVFDYTTSDYAWDLTNNISTGFPMFLNVRLVNETTFIDNATKPSIIFNTNTGNTYFYNVITKSFKAGNLYFVPVGTNLETFCDSIPAGSTMLLDYGTYTIPTGSDWDISKAINIVGQGIGKTIINCTQTATFNGSIEITSSNVRMAGFTYNYTHSVGASGTNAIYTTDGAISNLRFEDIEININESSASSSGIAFNSNNMADNFGELRNVRVNILSTASGAFSTYGFTSYLWSGRINTCAVKFYDCRVSTVAGSISVASGWRQIDDGSTYDSIFELHNCEATISGAATSMYGVYARGGNAKNTIYGGLFSGGTYDIFNDGGTITVYGATLVNGTTSGTITYAGTLALNQIKAAGQITSTVATGTEPLVVASTTAVSNLNADLLDGQHASEFLTAESDTLDTVTDRGSTTTNVITVGGVVLNALSVAANSQSVDDDGTIVLIADVAGLLEVWTEAEYMKVYVQADGTVASLYGSTNTAITDTDDTLCVYDGGTGAVIANRLGSAKTVRYVYTYS